VTPSSVPAWSTTLDLRIDVVPTSRGRVEVATTGEGPSALLIHGIPGSWRQCIPLAEDLADGPDGYKVVLPSRPGYGRTPIRTGRSYEHQADAFVALLDSLGIDRTRVLGISGGAPVAIAMAARHPDRVDGLVLACGMAPHLITAPLTIRIVKLPGVAPVLSKAIKAIGRRRARDEAYIDAQITKGLTPDELERSKTDDRIRSDVLRHELGHLAAPSGIHGLRNDLLQVETARHSTPPSYTVTCPALFMNGDADTVIPATHAEFYLGQVPDARTMTFEDAGHIFALTRRTESSAAIRSFFDKTL
jgi:pimeloyl-ACP methyl ester carboxylesterase